MRMRVHRITTTFHMLMHANVADVEFNSLRADVNGANPATVYKSHRIGCPRLLSTSHPNAIHNSPPRKRRVFIIVVQVVRAHGPPSHVRHYDRKTIANSAPTAQRQINKKMNRYLAVYLNEKVSSCP